MINTNTTFKEKFLEKLKFLKPFLLNNVLGHNDFVIEFCTNLKNQIINRDSLKPIASYLFVGPNNIGKTKVVKSFSHFFLNKDYNKNFLEVDLSIFSSLNSGQNLIQYLVDRLNKIKSIKKEYNDGDSFGILLFSNVEKATREVLLVLLNILTKGFFITKEGKTLFFNNCFVFVLSNVLNIKVLKHYLLNSIFINNFERSNYINTLININKIFIFNKLDRVTLEEIFIKKFNKIKEKYEKHLQKKIIVRPYAKQYFFDKAFDENENTSQIDFVIKNYFERELMLLALRCSDDNKKRAKYIEIKYAGQDVLIFNYFIVNVPKLKKIKKKD